MKNQRKMKVLGSCCWAKKRVSGGRNNRPIGLKNSEKKRKVLGPRALPRTLGTYAPAGPSSRAFLGWSQGPKMKAGNLLTRPTGPNYTYLYFLSIGELKSMGKRPPAGVARRRKSRAGREAAGARGSALLAINVLMRFVG